METSAPAYESQHVHTVYEQIAHHFSSTRYKPWPIIKTYLESRVPCSIGLDIGCGNGKNMHVNSNIYIIGSDRSAALVSIAATATKTKQQQQQDVVISHVLELPHPEGVFDFWICIAVIHHLSTRERRVAALQDMVKLLNETGTGLVYVWALEQKGSRRGWDEGGEQDVMVPWVVKGEVDEQGKEKVVQRYYHLYRRGELEEDVLEAGGVVKESGYEKDNWWAVVSRKALIEGK